MPNGESRNWIRFIGSLNGFSAIYGSWPTKVYLYPEFIKELQYMMPPGDFQRLETKVALIPEPKATFRCEDDQGRSYDYGQQGFARKQPVPDAMEWLNVSKPHYED